MERVFEPRTAPAGYARRWEVVTQRGERGSANAHVSVVSFNFGFQKALTALEERRASYEARGWVFQRSLDWAHTYEGVAANGVPVTLFIRPYLESAN